jgi:hypothetical protein
MYFEEQLLLLSIIVAVVIIINNNIIVYHHHHATQDRATRLVQSNWPRSYFSFHAILLFDTHSGIAWLSSLRSNRTFEPKLLRSNPAMDRWIDLIPSNVLTPLWLQQRDWSPNFFFPFESNVRAETSPIESHDGSMDRLDFEQCANSSSILTAGLILTAGSIARLLSVRIERSSRNFSDRIRRWIDGSTQFRAMC